MGLAEQALFSLGLLGRTTEVLLLIVGKTDLMEIPLSICATGLLHNNTDHCAIPYTLSAMQNGHRAKALLHLNSNRSVVLTHLLKRSKM